jgi:protocatechuate 3,4-dioxygenase beta subunit
MTDHSSLIIHSFCVKMSERGKGMVLNIQQGFSDKAISGLEVTLDVAVVDVTTCQPMPNVMVEVWSRA